LVAGIATAQLGTIDAADDEVCSFAGTIDYEGHGAVTTDEVAMGLTRSMSHDV
jgi:hypothetical protein